MTDSAVPQKDHDKIESADGGLSTSILRILKLLARPELAKWRLVMVIAILLTLGASVLEVVSPLLVGHAINQVMPGGGKAAVFGTALAWLRRGNSPHGALLRFMSLYTPLQIGALWLANRDLHHLAQATLVVATAAKSNSIMGFFSALAAVACAGRIVVVGPPQETSRPVDFVREDPPLGGPAAGLLAVVAGGWLIRNVLSKG